MHLLKIYLPSVNVLRRPNRNDKRIYEKAPVHAKIVLDKLFPGLRNTGLTYTRREFLKERRLCTPEYFDLYFELSLD